VGQGVIKDSENENENENRSENESETENESENVAGSRRVLPPRWTIGQKNLIALALSTSLRPRTIMRGGQRAAPMN
jgi:hypothetical protein